MPIVIANGKQDRVRPAAGASDTMWPRTATPTAGGPWKQAQATASAAPQSTSTMADLEDALRNADKAGDTAAATQLADEIVRRRSQPGDAKQPGTMRVEFDGQTVEFPDDFTDDEISDALSPLPPRSQSTGVQSKVPGQLARVPSGFRQGARPTEQAADDDNITAPLYLAQRADRGIADALGAPVDLATIGVNLGLMGADKLAELFGGNMDARIQKPFMGSDWLAEKAASAHEAIGGHIVQPEDVSPLVRLGGDAARFGTSALVGGAGLASKPVQMAAQGDGQLARIVGPLAKPYESGKGALLGDVAAGAGSGAAVNLYDEHAPDAVKNSVADPFLKMGAAMLGGGTGAAAHSLSAGSVEAGVNVGRNIVSGKGDRMAPGNEATGKRYTRSEMDQAARAVQAQASDPAAASAGIGRTIGEAREFATAGQLPTTGAASGDAGLALLERETRARDPKPFIERDRATTARAGEIIRDVTPEGAVGRDFTDAADALDASRMRTAQADVDTVRGAQQAHADAMRQAAAPVAAGAGQKVPASQALDTEIVGGSLRPMQDRKNQAFAGIDPDRNVVRDATPLIEAAGRIREGLGRLNDPNSILPVRTLDRIAALAPRQARRDVATGLLDEAGRPITRQAAVNAGGTGTITFAEINTLRPELSSAVTKARASGDYALADNIQALQGAIARETDRLAGEATPAGQRAADATRIYQDEFAPTWNVGPGDEATRFRKDVNVDRNARTQSPPSATAERFLKPGQPERAESLQRIMASLPDRSRAEFAARQHLVADMAESGVLDPSGAGLRRDALHRWRSQWGGALDVVPGFRAEVDNLLATADMHEMEASRLAIDVRSAEQMFDDVAKNKGALGLVLGKDPRNAAASIFTAGDPQRVLAEIKRTIGTNKRANDGLKAAAVDYITERATQAAVQKTADGSRPVDFGKLENLFSGHEDALAAVFSPDEMQALRRAHKLLRPGQELKHPGGAPTLYDARKSEQAMRLLKGGLKLHFGMLKGGGIMRTVRNFVSMLPNQDAAMRDIVTRMHFDPELAMHLLGRDVKANTPAWNAKLNRLLAVAAGAREDVEER